MFTKFIERDMLKDIAKKVEKVLKELGCNYFAIGRLPVVYWGRPVATMDIDLVIEIEKSKLAECISSLLKEGFSLDSTPEEAEKRLRVGKPKKFMLSPPYSVDLRISEFTIDKEALKRAIEVEIFGVKWKIPQPEELIVYKMAGGQSKDWEDIEGILMNRSIKLDWGRIKWLSKTVEEEYDSEFMGKFRKLQKLAESLGFEESQT